MHPNPCVMGKGSLLYVYLGLLGVDPNPQDENPMESNFSS